MKRLINGISMAICSILVLILAGFILTQMWAWFLVPLGVAAITIPWGLGIAFFACFLTMKPTMAVNPEVKGWNLLLVVLIADLILWASAAIAHLFM